MLNTVTHAKKYLFSEIEKQLNLNEISSFKTSEIEKVFL